MIPPLPNSLEQFRMHCWDYPHQLIPLLQTTTKLLKFQIIHSKFNEQFTGLPKSLKSLEIHNPASDQSVNLLPSSLELLHLGSHFNQKVQSLLQLVAVLQCVHCILRSRVQLWDNPPVKTNKFYLQIDNLPSSLKCLILGERGKIFNQPLNNLPPSLDRLELAGTITHPIDNLPDSITQLIFGGSFNLPINHLPASLNLLLLQGFDHPLTNLPPNLKTLDVGESFTHPLDNLPKGLKNLSVGAKFLRPIVDPPALTFLCTGERQRDFSWLPASLTELAIRTFTLLPDLPEDLPQYFPNVRKFSNLNFSAIDFTTWSMPALTEFECGPRMRVYCPSVRTYNFPVLQKFRLTESHYALEQVGCSAITVVAIAAILTCCCCLCCHCCFLTWFFW